MCGWKSISAAAITGKPSRQREYKTQCFLVPADFSQRQLQLKDRRGTLDNAANDRDELRVNEAGEVTLQTRAPLVFDNHDRVSTVGRFIIADRNNILGGGVISGALYTTAKAVKSENIFLEGFVSQSAHKARAGKLKGFTGIDVPYEAPTDPEIVVRTDERGPAECVDQILAALLPRLRLANS